MRSGVGCEGVAVGAVDIFVLSGWMDVGLGSTGKATGLVTSWQRRAVADFSGRNGAQIASPIKNDCQIANS
jgi:hypothetical protein